MNYNINKIEYEVFFLLSSSFEIVIKGKTFETKKLF